MAFEVRGVSGDVRKGYQIAARLGAWTLAHGRVTATPVAVDTFWLESDGPFGVRLQVGETEWQWRDADLVSRDPLVLTVTGAPDIRRA